MNPIGIFRCDAQYPYDVPRQGALAEGNMGRIELAEGRGFEEAAADLVGFSRIWLVFVFDRNVGTWHPKVQPPRHTNRKIGVFATRSPYRPNPIGLTCSELIDIKGLTLYIKAHDLLDGTPILDIKPYLPYAYAFPDAQTGWTADAEELYSVEFSDLARAQCDWLAAHGVPCLEQFVQTRLECAPLDGGRNRLVPDPQKPDEVPLLAYRTWRVRFQCDSATRAIRVLEILSGYRAEELSPGAPDPYADKAAHREFNAIWAG
ncbi:MAG: tRNA (N6-threonylcarbamoyladenosine(37)-N6)-methyltransferase TrmO [Victivallales bacterium]|nr:tRNA (N6-threonylcarbamoyladenosine(37)-N6)-methyltransferase TrmO [Victivallales bacterium]